jgi:multisubunit Na+/H+ antiporter MnhB subunit
LDLGLSLIALTMAIHATGIVFLAFATERIRVRVESLDRLSLRHVLAIVIGLIGVIGLLLAALRGIEAALWAAVYWSLGALSSLQEAILYSVDSISTRGASGLMLERHWRMMGAVEAMDGMLLFGISTASSR